MARGKALDDDILTDSTFYILLSLVNPMHGYGIMNSVKEKSDGSMVIGPASLYTILKKLQDSSLIELISKDDERKKTYGLTEKGKCILRKDIKRRIVMVEHGKEALNILEGES